jgi:hypothetical protein
MSPMAVRAPANDDAITATVEQAVEKLTHIEHELGLPQPRALEVLFDNHLIPYR